MAFALLSELHPHDRLSKICIKVVRKWEYRGPADDGPIHHIDLVLADQEGNAMYAEIPQDVTDDFDAQIQENGIYTVSRFRVTNAKHYFRAVEGRYMIEFTYHTRIAAPANPPSGFPKYVYTLTPFDELPNLVGNTRNFLDILGTVTEVSQVEPVQISPNRDPIPTRKLTLRDARDTEIHMTLWGQRAIDFNIEELCSIKDGKPVRILFVGCLMKTFRGQDYISGGSACKWYLDPDIPEISEFSRRLSNERIHVNRSPPPLNPPQERENILQQESRYLADLQRMDPYDFPENGCLCTVTIARLIPAVPWWFASCTRCGKACTGEGNSFICYQCNCSNYRYKYRLPFIATDGTAEAEMTCFGPVAQRIVGKTVDTMMRTVRRDENFPPEIASIVSQRYTFSIMLTNQSYYTRIKKYIITSVTTSHGRQRVIPQLPPPPPPGKPGHPPRHTTSGNSEVLDTYVATTTPDPSLQNQSSHTSASTSETPTGEPALPQVAESTSPQNTGKRLAHNDSSDEEEPDHDLPKRSKVSKRGTTIETSDQPPSADLPSKRYVRESFKSAATKTAETKGLRHKDK